MDPSLLSLLENSCHILGGPSAFRDVILTLIIIVVSTLGGAIGGFMDLTKSIGHLINDPGTHSWAESYLPPGQSLSASCPICIYFIAFIDFFVGSLLNT